MWSETKRISAKPTAWPAWLPFDLTSRYDYICLMDADTQVSDDYFESVRKSFEQPGVAAVCGRAKSTPHNWLTAYRCLAYWISTQFTKTARAIWE